MLVLRDLSSIAQLKDPELRKLIDERVEALGEFDDCELQELVTFIVVEPGDSLATLDDQLGFSVLNRPFELCEEHAGYFELLFVISNDGSGSRSSSRGIRTLIPGCWPCVRSMP